MEPKDPKKTTDSQIPEIKIVWTQDFQGWSDENGQLPKDIFEILRTLFQLDTGDQGASETQELETLDQKVTGDYHPQALDMIMGAYRRIEDDRRI